MKIDGSFIRDLLQSTVDQHMVKAMVEVARGLGKQTVAEYVESKEIIQMLIEYGIDYAQGYYIGKPGKSLRYWDIKTSVWYKPKQI